MPQPIGPHFAMVMPSATRTVYGDGLWEQLPRVKAAPAAPLPPFAVDPSSFAIFAPETSHPGGRPAADRAAQAVVAALLAPGSEVDIVGAHPAKGKLVCLSYTRGGVVEVRFVLRFYPHRDPAAAARGGALLEPQLLSCGDPGCWFEVRDRLRRGLASAGLARPPAGPPRAPAGARSLPAGAAVPPATAAEVRASVSAALAGMAQPGSPDADLRAAALASLVRQDRAVADALASMEHRDRTIAGWIGGACDRLQRAGLGLALALREAGAAAPALPPGALADLVGGPEGAHPRGPSPGARRLAWRLLAAAPAAAPAAALEAALRDGLRDERRAATRRAASRAARAWGLPGLGCAQPEP